MKLMSVCECVYVSVLVHVCEEGGGGVHTAWKGSIVNMIKETSLG